MPDSKDEYFVRVPHWVMEFLMKAKLNMTQFRIINAVIRNTYGFHKSWNWFSLNFLSQLTGCSNPQVTRELRKLIDQKILIEKYEEGKRLLRINPLLEFKGANPPPQLLQGTNSLVSSGTNPLDSEGTNSLDSHIKKETKEKESKEKHYIDFEKIDDIPFLTIYINLHKKIRGKKHVRISEESLVFIDEQIQYLIDVGVTEEEWVEKSVLYLKKEVPEGNNGSIVYFLEITYRYFDVGRYDQYD